LNQLMKKTRRTLRVLIVVIVVLSILILILLSLAFSGVNFINVFCALFLYESLFLAAFSSYILALAKNLYKKCARLTLMKLMAGFSFKSQSTTTDVVLSSGNLTQIY